jgi:hypothetical protein
LRLREPLIYIVNWGFSRCERELVLYSIGFLTDNSKFIHSGCRGHCCWVRHSCGCHYSSLSVFTRTTKTGETGGIRRGKRHTCGTTLDDAADLDIPRSKHSVDFKFWSTHAVSWRSECHEKRTSTFEHSSRCQANRNGLIVPFQGVNPNPATSPKIRTMNQRSGNTTTAGSSTSQGDFNDRSQSSHDQRNSTNPNDFALPNYSQAMGKSV